MNQKIESMQEARTSDKDDFARGFIPSIICLTLFILLCLFGIEHQHELFHTERTGSMSETPPFVTLFPTMQASFHTIHNGLLAFNGRAPEAPNLTDTLGVLTSMLLAYVVIPTVFFFHWRKRRIESKRLFSRGPLTMAGIIYVLSALFVISIAVGVMYSAYASHHFRASMEQAQAIQVNKDEIINEINFIVMDAHQYKILPRELGGGNGTYSGFVLSPDRTKTKNGIYTVTTSENQLTINAQSLLFSSNKFSSITTGQGPFGGIIVTIDPQGQLGNWKFEGVFK
jgi:hypothetical protein